MAATAPEEFTCNICGTVCSYRIDELDREIRSCAECGSTPRVRGVVHALSCELFGASLAIADFPRRPELCGLGLSDWNGYAHRLPDRLGYTNTFFHKEPYLDITEGAPDLEGSLDFLISSEVFEHVEPPVSRAFRNARALLREGGVMILTVPYGDGGETVEHFPNLNEYSIAARGEGHVLRNVTSAGEVEEFEDLSFHGGPGTTLEMRYFSRRALFRELLDAGFDRVTVYGPVRSRGIYFQVTDRGLPIAARA